MASIFDHVASGGTPATFDPMAAAYGVPADATQAPALDAAGAVASSAVSGHAADDLRGWIASSYPQGTGALRAAALTPAMLGAQAADSLSDAARYAAGGYAGLDVTDPASVAAALPHVVNAVGLMGGAGLPAVEDGAAETLASRTASLYNPKPVEARPLALDYPQGAPVDAAGNLTHDIDGRPLGARYIAGRTSGAGADQAITPAQYDAIAEGITSGRPQALARSKVPGGGAGAFVVGRGADGPTRDIFFDRTLAPTAQNRVIAHELGHAVDEVSGQISTASLGPELGRVYNDLNNSQTYGKPWTPKNNGYSSADAPRELMAEAVRAYMTDPNYMKTVAPNTAAAIRGAVNGNPLLNGTIQFNARGDAAAPLALASHAPTAADDPLAAILAALDGHAAANPEAGTASLHPRALAPEQLAQDAPDGHFLAYHGSPALFDAFDLAHLGSGEGAQVQGHGMYFAGDQNVGAHYADTYGTPRTLPDGSTVNGHMYQVAIPGRPEDFFDQDLSLAEQSPAVRAAVAPLYDAAGLTADYRGGNLLHEMRQNALSVGVPFGSVDQHISRQFQDAGIPGHRYAGQGDAPNYVVFDPSNVRIMQTYASGLPANALLSAGAPAPAPSTFNALLAAGGAL